MLLAEFILRPDRSHRASRVTARPPSRVLARPSSDVIRRQACFQPSLSRSTCIRCSASENEDSASTTTALDCALKALNTIVPEPPAAPPPPAARPPPLPRQPVARPSAFLLPEKPFGAPPWGFFTFIQALFSAELGFMLAGAAAPLIILALSDGGLPADVNDLARLLGSPQQFYKVVFIAEAVQLVVIGSLLWLLFWPFRESDAWGPDLFRFLPESKPKSPPALDAAVSRRPATEPQANWPVVGVVGGAATLGLVAVISIISHAANPGSGAASNSLITTCLAGGIPGTISLVVSIVLLAPVLEETIFRGCVLVSLTKWLPTWAAIALSSIIFALLHEQGSGDSLQLLIVGIVAGTAYVNTRVLAAPILIHASYNLSVILLYAAWTH